MFFQRLDGGVNKDRFVRNDLDVDARRQTLTDLIELASDEVDDCNRVRAGLAANVELYGLFAVHHIPGGRLSISIFNAPDVAHSDRRSFDVRDYDVAELAYCSYPSQCAHTHLGIAPNNSPARNFDVLILNRSPKLIDRDAVRIQFFCIGVQADLSGPSSSESHGADSVDGLQHAFDLFVGNFGRFAN